MREQTYQLQIDSLSIRVTKKNIKNMYLRVKREDGSVQLSAPYEISDALIRDFVISRMGWIKNHQKQYQKQREAQKTVPTLSAAELAAQKKRLRDKVLRLISKWEPRMGVQVSGVTIRQMKTRWGSCNVKTHHININLALLEKPEECLEYVVVHEMTHILEASHNATFWGYMTQFYPDWKRVRARLRQ